MELEPLDAWRELEKARREADRLLEGALERLRDELASREIAFVPTADVVETAEALHVFLSLPGVLEEDIDLSVSGDTLVVRGEREIPFAASTATFRVRQWKYGYFEHRVRLPAAFDLDSIDARLENGVLSITVPKAARREGERRPGTP